MESSGCEGDDGPLGVGAVALDVGAPVARGLALAVERVDVGHPHAEGLLDGVAHVDLGGAGVDDEDVDVLVHQRVGLLRDDRPDEHGHGVTHRCRPPRRLGRRLGLGRPRRLASSASASAVGSPAAAFAGLGRLGLGASPAGGLGRARAARSRRRPPGRVASVKTTQSLTQDVVGVELAERDGLGLGQVGERAVGVSRRRRPSTTSTRAGQPELAQGGDGVLGPRRRRSAQSSTSATRPVGGPVATGRRAGPGGPSSSGVCWRSCGAWARGPRRRRLIDGERLEPWRARPVPFWRNGLAPPPRTSARVLVDWVPDAGGGQLGGDHLVQHGQVGLDAEDRSARGRPCPRSCPATLRRVDGAASAGRRARPS